MIARVFIVERAERIPLHALTSPLWRSSGALGSRSETPEGQHSLIRALAIDMILKKAVVPSMRRLGVG